MALYVPIATTPRPNAAEDTSVATRDVTVAMLPHLTLWGSNVIDERRTNRLGAEDGLRVRPRAERACGGGCRSLPVGHAARELHGRLSASYRRLTEADGFQRLGWGRSGLAETSPCCAPSAANFAGRGLPTVIAKLASALGQCRSDPHSSPCSGSAFDPEQPLDQARWAGPPRGHFHQTGPERRRHLDHDRISGYLTVLSTMVRPLLTPPAARPSPSS